MGEIFYQILKKYLIYILVMCYLPASGRVEREGVSGAAGLHRGHQHHGDLADQRHHLQLSLRQICPGRADGKTSVWWWVEWWNFVKYQIFS